MAWSGPAASNAVTSFFKKTKKVKEALVSWNKNIVGNIFKDGEKLAAKLDTLQLKEAEGRLSMEEEEELKATTVMYHNLLRQQEALWRQKSRVLWLKEGDRNSRFFHRAVVCRRSRNLIRELECEDGEKVGTREAIASKFVEYFKERWNPISEEETPELCMIPTVVTTEDNDLLTVPFTMVEVEKVVKELNSDKAPGPDGLNGLFYKSSWEVIKEDMLEAILHFQSSKCLPKQWKATFIALIPKVANPSRANDYRPISLCNVCYKIISKLIVNRMKPLLPVLISEEQSAFVPGRAIMDNVFVAQEVLHSMRKHGAGSQLMAIKLDMERAYDRMSWSFIRAVLLKFGFVEGFVDMVMACVRDPSFAVLINGTPSEWFSSSTGLRQGDPLSPYLFIIGAEVFIRMVKAAREEGKISGFNLDEGEFCVSQLQYADDCILFCKASLREARAMNNLVNKYCRMSGQKVNVAKSSIVMGEGVSHRQRRQVFRTLLMSPAVLPMKYLGTHIGVRNLRTRDFEPLVNKVKLKLCSWKAGSLSFAGRIVLVKAVLEVIPTFLMTAGWVPKTVLDRLDQLMRRFLWAKNSGSRGMALVSWEKICAEKEMGGLGIRSMKTLYEALKKKQLCRLLADSQSVGGRLVKSKYHVGNRLWEWRCKSGVSQNWRAIRSTKEAINEHLEWAIKDGTQVNFWRDTWLQGVPLCRLPLSVNYAVINSELLVSEFLSEQGGWDEDKLREVVPQEMVTAIKQVRVFSRADEDTLVWKGDELGRVRVSELYKDSMRYRETSLPNEARRLDWLWKLMVTPRCKGWLWKLWHEAIPTKAFLYSRGLSTNLRCARCKDYAEDNFHLIIRCHSSRAVWLDLGRKLQLNLEFNSMNSWWDAVKNSGERTGIGGCFVQAMIAETAWTIWKKRNEVIFTGACFVSKSVVEEAYSRVLEMQDILASGNEEVIHALQLHKGGWIKWELPPEGFYKINFDGGYDGRTGFAAASCVLRDWAGELIIAKAIPINVTSGYEAECRGMSLAVEVATQVVAGRKVIVEGDARRVLHCQFEQRKQAHVPELQHNANMLASFEEVRWSFVHREGNVAADYMVHACKEVNAELVFTNIVPMSLCEVIKRDCMGPSFWRS